MNKLSSILPLALILLAACGPAPADDLDGSTSGGDSTTGGESSAGPGSTSEDSTSEAMDDASMGGESSGGSTSGLTGGDASSSSGDESTSGDASSTTGEPWMGGSCWAEQCDDAAQPCREGLTCMEDPMHLGVKVCVAGCNGGDDCRVATLVCGELAPQGECRGTLCFPVTCEAVGDCPLGSTCDVVAGFCY